jgi:lipopolysaccharide assembly outer membrane protein LptD (OstA)
MVKRAVLALVLGSNTLLGAQTPDKVLAPQAERTASNPDITRMTGGVTVSTLENVQLKADEAEYNQSTGEIVLHGPVVLRQQLRPAAQTPATNLAGEPFPAPKEVVMRMRGGLQIAIGELIIRADEADVNGLTGEMTLRGNVRMLRPEK